MEIDRLFKQVRWLKIYCIAVTGALAVIVFSGAAQRNRFEELTVERLNVVDASGKIRLAISNADRFPAVLLDGKTLKRAVNPAGFVFYNAAGSEVGGLAISPVGDGRLSALVFDYPTADAIGVLTHIGPDGKDTTAGIVINSRPDRPLDADQTVKPRGQRVALQNHNETAELVLSDPEGRPRLRLSVAPDGSPRIDMLDQNGGSVYSLPR